MVHKAVLEAFSLEKILTPEEDAARSLVQLLDFGTSVEAFRVDSEYYVVKFTVPKKFVGYFVNELNLDEEFHLKLIGLKRADKVTNCLGISLMELHVKNELPGDEKVEEGDELVCYSKYRDFNPFGKLFDYYSSLNIKNAIKKTTITGYFVVGFCFCEGTKE